MAASDQPEHVVTLEHLRNGIREITHDVSNPLGVLRMAVYYLQHGKPDPDKQEHYFSVIAESVERVEAGLSRLRALSDNPAVRIQKRDAPGNDTKGSHG
ncbi:MAG: histidine kinase dimerization/phospho-acceptor domain-containing protein [Bacteroidota bacterium]